MPSKICSPRLLATRTALQKSQLGKMRHPFTRAHQRMDPPPVGFLPTSTSLTPHSAPTWEDQHKERKWTTQRTRSWATNYRKSRSRPFPSQASDFRYRIMGIDFYIPFPFPNFGNGFFPFPSRSRIDPFKVGNLKGKWEILRDASIPTFSASCTFHPIYMPSIC